MQPVLHQQNMQAIHPYGPQEAITLPPPHPTPVLGQVGRKHMKYQPGGDGGTRSQPATPHRLQNPIRPPGGPKMAARSCQYELKNREKNQKHKKIENKG